MLCGTGAGLVRTIRTLPAFAASVVLLNLSAPLGSALSASVCAVAWAGGFFAFFFPGVDWPLLAPVPGAGVPVPAAGGGLPSLPVRFFTPACSLPFGSSPPETAIALVIAPTTRSAEIPMMTFSSPFGGKSGRRTPIAASATAQSASAAPTMWKALMSVARRTTERECIGLAGGTERRRDRPFALAPRPALRLPESPWEGRNEWEPLTLAGARDRRGVSHGRPAGRAWQRGRRRLQERALRRHQHGARPVPLLRRGGNHHHDCESAGRLRP